MDEETPANTAECLKRFLVETVREHYKSTGEGLLLANLGWAMVNQKPELRKGLGRTKISDFIQLWLTDSIELATDPKNTTIKLAYPIPRSVGDALGDVLRTPTRSSSLSPRRYAHAVMVAFTRPIPPDCRRWLALDSVIYFEDLPSGKMPDDRYEIRSDFIVALPTDLVARKTAMSELDTQVDRWLTEHGLPEESLQEKLRSPLDKRGKHANLLEHLLASLTEAEQKRIQFPLDIIAKLRKTPR